MKKSIFLAVILFVLMPMLAFGADKSISELPAASVSSDGSEVFPVVQSSSTKKMSLSQVATWLDLGEIVGYDVGTLTDAKYCTYSTTSGFVCDSDAMSWPESGVAVSTGSAWSSSLNTDGSGNCSAGYVCLGGHEHTSYQTALTYPVTGVASPTAGVLTKWNVSGNQIMDGLKLGTLTDAKYCTYSSTNGLVCTSGGTMTYPGGGVAYSTGSAWGTSLGIDDTGDCAASALCGGGHEHSEYQTLLTYPVTGVASPTAGVLTKWGASGNALADGLKMGTLTTGKYCTYDTTNGLVCNSDGTSGMTYPGTGVAVSTGSAWDTSLSTDDTGPCTADAVCLGGHDHTDVDIDPDLLVGDDTDDDMLDLKLIEMKEFEGSPGQNDDSDDGYTVGWLWKDTSTDCIWAAKDVTVGAAVWVSQCRPPLQENYILIGSVDGIAEETNVIPLGSISDAVYFEYAGDSSKQLEFDLSGVSASTKRTYVATDRSGTVALTQLLETIKTSNTELTTTEAIGGLLSNYGETDDADLILSLPDLDNYPGANFIYRIATTMSTNDTCLKAADDNNFMLAGTAGGDDGCICNGTPTAGDKLTCVAWTSGSGVVIVDCEATRGTWALVADNTGDCPD